jgi:YD repeat-containing protein
MSGFTDTQVKMDKWIYSADNGYITQPINRMWCLAAGGTWVADINPTCANLPSSVLGGGGRLTNDEGVALGVAIGFATAYLNCNAFVVYDSGWLLDTTRNVLGIPTLYNRTIDYAASGSIPGQMCGLGVSVVFVKQRMGKCPAGYTSRTATTGPECVVPADCSPCQGNPVSVMTGAKLQKEDDYLGLAETGLQFSRYYKSTGYYWPDYLTPVGGTGNLKSTDYWRHTYQTRLIPVAGNGQISAALQRPDGSFQMFDSAGAEKTNATGGGAHIQFTQGSGWDVTLADSGVEHYNRRGQVTTCAYTGMLLRTVTGPFGHRLTLGYNDDNQLTSVTLPDGGVIYYYYEPNETQRLGSVAYPDSKTRSYLYGDILNRYLLTAIQDEAGQTFGTYSYDALGRVTSESHAGGVASYAFTYGAAFGQPTTVTDPLGTATQFGLTSAGGMYRSASHSQPVRLTM